MIQFVVDHYHLFIHAAGLVLLGVSEIMGLSNSPGKAKGIVDGLLKYLQTNDPSAPKS